jgi:hypothetical protein
MKFELSQQIFEKKAQVSYLIKISPVRDKFTVRTDGQTNEANSRLSQLSERA